MASVWPGMTFADIEAAAERMRAAGLATPQIASETLSKLTGASVVLKLETLQPTGSFKVRGALNKLASLNLDERKRGVIAMSAGNHAQGVAYHAHRMNIAATIVMPLDTPFTKIRETERLGAKVILQGADLTEARGAMELIAHRHNLVVIPPYDDTKIIVGQGTVAIELLARFSDLDCLIVPVGGGGLIAGVCIAAKNINPDIEIVGVETELYPSMRNALTGETRPTQGRTTAEGIAVAQHGLLTRAITAEFVSDIVLVTEDEIERAIVRHFHETRLVVEGAGAAPLAALMKNLNRFQGRKVGLVVSGGNIDDRLFSSILLRGLARDGYLVRIRVEIEDRPGELAEIAELIAESGGNIVEVVHQRLFYDIPVKQAEVDITLETRDRGHVDKLLSSLTIGGFPARLLSNTADD